MLVQSEQQSWQDAVRKINTKIEAIIGKETNVVIRDDEYPWSMWNFYRTVTLYLSQTERKPRRLSFYNRLKNDSRQAMKALQA